MSETEMAKVGHVPLDQEAALGTDVSQDAASGDDIEKLIRDHPVMMFSKTTCAFCLELKRTLEADGIPYAHFEVNKSANLPAVVEKLNSLSGIKTFPNLFINGKSVGGCMDLKKKEHEGAFTTLFNTISRGATKPESRVRGTGLFWFPETVNRHSAQVAGFIGMVISILCVAFWKMPATPYVVLALAIDFFGRLLFGGSVTPIGVLSNLIVYPIWRKPLLMAGPPKQFAAFCGFFMSGLSAALFLADQRLGGVIVVGALIFPSACEGLFDFCFGCWIFGLGIRFGFISPSVYRPYLNMYNDKNWAWEFTHNQPAQPEPNRVHVLMPNQKEETPIDLIRKDRIETEYKLQDNHMIKHARVDIFAWPMAIMALAFCYKVNSVTYGTQVEVGDWGTRRVFQALAITAAVLFCFFFVLFLLRIFFYPQKVIKEWRHPIFGNSFSAINICIVLFGYVMYDEDLNFGIALVWIGSVFQMLITVTRVSALVFERVGDDMINPAIMISPVSNFICAFALSEYDGMDNAHKYEGAINYVNLSRLWFAVAALFAVIFFAITFNKAIRDHHSDARSRPTIFIWMATASVAGPSYYAVTRDSGNTYQCLWMLAIFFFAVNINGYLRSFHTQVQDHSVFYAGFAFAALAFSTFHYYIFVADWFTRVLAIISLAIASTAVANSSFQAVFWCIDGVFFKPRPKWGPVNFMKLTHEAFRFGLPHLVAQLQVLSENSSTQAIAYFLKDFDAMLDTYLEHGNHEEVILFPAVRRYFPGMNLGVSSDHEYQHGIVDKIQESIKKWHENPNAINTVAMLTVLKEQFPGWADHVLHHLRDEEASISVVARKYFSLDEQKELTKAVYDLTPAAKWQNILPFVLRNLPMPQWKIQFLRTFIWANPSIAQQIGLFVYRGTDSVLYQQLVEDIPEMIPRGAGGFWYRRNY